MKNIFISYGHDEHADLAIQLKNDLENVGYTVWIDGKKIKPQNYWDHAIEKGIGLSDWLIVLMTPHSMRRPDGVCLDEISYARFQGKEIVPIMVQQIQPPLAIARIQWLDLQNYKQNEKYQKGFEEICKVLIGEYKLGFEGELSLLKSKLAPFDDSGEIGKHMQSFVGRKWLYEEFQSWVEHQSESRVFWLTGPAGIGKSAFSAKLALESKNVVGVHFFKHNDSDKRDPKRAICALAYYLASQLPEYMNYLIGIDLGQNNLAEKNLVALFNYLLVEPLNIITPPDKRYVLVLDALDEAQNISELLDVIGNEFQKVPSWLGLVITSRPEADILRRLGRLKPVEFSALDQLNLQDIETYLRKNLDIAQISYEEWQISLLLDKSEGIFLYVTEVMNELRKGRLSLLNINEFPAGLKGVYLSFFERQFPDLDMYAKEIRPLLELVMVASGPLPIELIRTILSWDDYQEVDILEQLGSLFYIKDECIEPYHKSIKDWIVDRNNSGKYFVSEKQGHKKLIMHYTSENLENNNNPANKYYLSHYQQHLREMQDWQSLKSLLTNNQYVAAKIRGKQSMDLLDFYKEVIEDQRIDSSIREAIDKYYKLSRLRILFDMDHFFK